LHYFKIRKNVFGLVLFTIYRNYYDKNQILEYTTVKLMASINSLTSFIPVNVWSIRIMGTYKTDSSTNRSHGILKYPRTEVEFIKILDHFVGRNIVKAVEHFGIPEHELDLESGHKAIKFTKSAISFNSQCTFTINNVGNITNYEFVRGEIA